MIPLRRRQHLTALADGYAEHLESAMSYLEGRGIDRQMAEEFGLGCVPAGRFRGWLAIPYWTPAGVVSIKYRRLDDGSPKYLYEEGEGGHLYNAYSLLKAERCLVVEGELKTVVVQSCTGIPTVGYPGTKHWKDHFSLCFEGLAEVIVVADDGEPGHKAAGQVAKKIGGRARVVYTPEGMDDPDTFIARQGADAFLSLIGEK